MKKITGEGETARQALKSVAMAIEDEDVGEELVLTVTVKRAPVNDYWNHVSVPGFVATVELP